MPKFIDLSESRSSRRDAVQSRRSHLRHSLFEKGRLGLKHTSCSESEVLEETLDTCPVKPRFSRFENEKLAITFENSDIGQIGPENPSNPVTHDPIAVSAPSSAPKKEPIRRVIESVIHVPDPVQRKPKGKKPRLCWRCRSAYHDRSSCRAPRAIREDRVQCIVCKERGHRASDCLHA